MFCFFDSFGASLQDWTRGSVGSFLRFSVWQPPSPPPLSMFYTETIAGCPSQTCDEDSIKSTAFVPGRGQKGCLCGKAAFSRCKLLEEWDRGLLELEPGMSKAFCAILIFPIWLCLWQSDEKGEKFLYHTHLALPCSPAGLSGIHKQASDSWPCGRGPRLPRYVHSEASAGLNGPISQSAESRPAVPLAQQCRAPVAHLQLRKRDSRDPTCVITATLFWCPTLSGQAVLELIWKELLLKWSPLTALTSSCLKSLS